MFKYYTNIKEAVLIRVRSYRADRSFALIGLQNGCSRVMNEPKIWSNWALVHDWKTWQGPDG